MQSHSLVQFGLIELQEAQAVRISRIRNLQQAIQKEMQVAGRTHVVPLANTELTKNGRPSSHTDHWPSMSYSPSSSSNSPSSSAVASWYCWYSDTRSFMLLSASVNSISSTPSPVYQCRNAFRRNIAVKYSATRLNISWMAVELPANATAILRPLGGMSHTEALMLFGIHSTKYDEFLICPMSICSSTSL